MLDINMSTDHVGQVTQVHCHSNCDAGKNANPNPPPCNWKRKIGIQGIPTTLPTKHLDIFMHFFNSNRSETLC